MLEALNILADRGGTFWLPPSSSSYADDMDWLFWFIMAICVIFFILVAALVVVFVWKYRYRPGVAMQDAPKHNTALELTWTFVPTVLVIIIFVYGFKGYLRVTVPPPNTYEIVVMGSMWHWQFQYPNGHQDTELHLPKDVPIQFILTSSDVIHGFYVPAFRMKKDVVPARYNKMWAQPNELGVFDIYCTQYCGEQHSMMRSQVTVQTRPEFDAWLDMATTRDNTLPPLEHGKALYTQKSCVTCHSLNGTRGIGPSWLNVYGHEVKFNDGTQIIADEDYLRSMIVKPNNRIVVENGVPFPPQMPDFSSQLREKTHDVDDLITFIKSNSDMYRPTGPTSNPTSGPATQPVTEPATRPATEPAK